MKISERIWWGSVFAVLSGLRPGVGWANRGFLVFFLSVIILYCSLGGTEEELRCVWCGWEGDLCVSKMYLRGRHIV